MIRILFLINTLGGGGAERVLVNLVNNMDKSKFDITVTTMFAGGVNQKLLSKKIHFRNKNMLRLRGLPLLVKFISPEFLYKYYIGKREYDIIVAYMHGAPTKVVSGCNTKAKRVTWLHYGNPQEGSFFDYWTDKNIAIQAYKKMDALVGVSKAVSASFSDFIGDSHRVVTLYNTNDTERILNSAMEQLDIEINHQVPIICTSGRLVNQKGFDRLIKQCSVLHSEGFNFNLIIMGGGPDEKMLQRLIEDVHAMDYISLVGFRSNPYNVMFNSDFYVSSSREEGLATVLTEALTLGLPVVSTDVSGAKEVLGDNSEFGLVVENSEKGIYAGIKRFLTDSDLIQKYRNGAVERAKIFSTENTVSKTEGFFENIIKL